MEDQSEDYKLFNEAQLLAKNWTRNRSGFGAFRHYKKLFQNTANLVFESSVFTFIESLSVPVTLREKTVLDFLLGKLPIDHKVFFENLLAKPATFEPRANWALFWALSKAEHQFMIRYTPFWSHEER